MSYVTRLVILRASLFNRPLMSRWCLLSVVILKPDGSVESSVPLAKTSQVHRVAVVLVRVKVNQAKAPVNVDGRVESDTKNGGPA